MDLFIKRIYVCNMYKQNNYACKQIDESDEINKKSKIIIPISGWIPLFLDKFIIKYRLLNIPFVTLIKPNC